MFRSIGLVLVASMQMSVFTVTVRGFALHAKLSPMMGAKKEIAAKAMLCVHGRAAGSV